MLNEQIRKQLIADIKGQMSHKRFEHVLRVERKAIELATMYGVPIDLCQYAALLHDYAKEWTMEQYETIVEEAGLNGDLLLYGSELLHGPVAAYVVQKKFDISNQDVLDAIAYHTIGNTQMSGVAKVLFIADYIEDGRTFNGVETARLLARQSLDEVILYKLKQTIIFLAQKEVPIYPDTIVHYNYWVKTLRKR